MANRKFTREFKLSAVKLVNEQGYTIPQAAKSLGVDPNCVRYWVTQVSGRQEYREMGSKGAIFERFVRLFSAQEGFPCAGMNLRIEASPESGDIEGTVVDGGENFAAQDLVGGSAGAGFSIVD